MNNNNNTEALRLAQRLEILVTNEQDHQAAASELRRLHALNAELVEALSKCVDAMTWQLGGEPLDTLLITARDAARAALARATTQGEMK